MERLGSSDADRFLRELTRPVELGPARPPLPPACTGSRSRLPRAISGPESAPKEMHETPKCVHEVQGSHEYWIEKLEEVRRPELKLIKGDGKNPEHGHEHLRLVEAPDHSDDPGGGNEIP